MITGIGPTATGPLPVPSLFMTDGIWTWYNDPRAWYDVTQNCTFVGAVSAAGHTILSRYHHATGYSRRFDVGVSTGDDHCNPFILTLDAAGSRPDDSLLGYTEHGLNAFDYYGETPGASAFSPRQQVDTSRSYSLVCQLNNTARTVYWFYRDQSSGVAFDWPHKFETSTDGGVTWSVATEYFNNHASLCRPYFLFYSSGNRVDFAVNPGVTGDPGASPVSTYHFYFTVAADGTRSWFKSDGTQIGTGDSALPLTAANVTLVADGTTRDTLAWDICNIGGTLSILYAQAVTPAGWTGTARYCRAIYTGGVWTTEVICDAGTTDGSNSNLGTPGIIATYSGGLCCDPFDINSVYVSRAYADGDWRVEKWTRTLGVWGKAIDVTGASGNGRINARPTWCRNNSTTQIYFWSATKYNSYTDYAADVYTYPSLTINTYTTAQQAKPLTPAWQASHAPLGVNGYWPLTEGSGTTVVDLFTSPHNGTFVGVPVWATGSFGAELGSFSTTKYVAINPASQLMGTGSYPFWAAILYKNSDTTTNCYALSQGSSSSATPIISLEFNNGTNKVGQFIRSDDNATQETAITGGNDGNYHVLMVVVWAANRGAFYLDGVQGALSSTTLGTFTDNRLALGVLLRSAASNAFTGTIVAAACGSGNCPDPADFADDWLSGAFAAIRP